MGTPLIYSKAPKMATEARNPCFGAPKSLEHQTKRVAFHRKSSAHQAKSSERRGKSAERDTFWGTMTLPVLLERPDMISGNGLKTEVSMMKQIQWKC